MRTEEELAIWALVEVIAIWVVVLYMVGSSLHDTPTSVAVPFCQLATALMFLPALALGLVVRRFRIERKEKEAKQ